MISDNEINTKIVTTIPEVQGTINHSKEDVGLA